MPCVLYTALYCTALQPGDMMRVLVHRGLRVRIGIHSGLGDANGLTYNKGSGRTQYTGEAHVASRLASQTGTTPTACY